MFLIRQYNHGTRHYTYGIWGWLGEAKVSCILHHQGIQLILAYSWARPAVLVAGKGKRGRFLFLLFLHFHSFSFLSCPFLSSRLLSLLPFISSTISSISFLPFGGGGRVVRRCCVSYITGASN